VLVSDCLFCKIVRGEIPSKKAYEDDKVYAFHDIQPGAPTHILIVPKKHIAGVNTATAEDAEIIGYSHVIAAKLAREGNMEQSGYRTVYNVGPDAGQSVFHLHLHLMGGRKMAWPPG
jgi:histidine triad (HIT) family protein